LEGSLIVEFAKEDFLQATKRLSKLDYQSYNTLESDGRLGYAQTSPQTELCAALDELESLCTSITSQLTDLKE
jgi:hypothetical protein